MGRFAEAERWRPDETLVLTVRTRVLPIAELSGSDRAWIVAALTAQGWTVAAIAERLSCSLRLIQQIKAEPTVQVALYAMGLARDLEAERGVRRLADLQHQRELSIRDHALERVRAQRDLLLNHITPRKTG
jgi:hypothetical protein